MAMEVGSLQWIGKMDPDLPGLVNGLTVRNWKWANHHAIPHDESMVLLYNMDPINIPPLC